MTLNQIKEITNNPLAPSSDTGIKLPELGWITNLDPIDIVHWLFVAVLLLTTVSLALFAFLTLRQIRILNRVLKTPLAPILTLFALLYLILTIGTLFLSFTLWIRPLF